MVDVLFVCKESDDSREGILISTYGRGLLESRTDVLKSILYQQWTCIWMVAFWLLQFKNSADFIASRTLRLGTQIKRLVAF